MMYKLVITEHADEQLDRLVYHLICRLKNKEAAQRLLDAIDDIYDRLISNPQQFPLSGDAYLAAHNYHEAITVPMSYKVIFEIKSDVVNVLGIFHQLENYVQKL